MSNQVEESPVPECGPPEYAGARPYRMGRRQIAADENRARIVAAARELIMSDEALKGFTIDAVAKRAQVARMTVYHQFKSKLGLLEALFDELGSQGGMERMREVFTEPDPVRAISIYIQIFCQFWTTDPIIMQRLGALNTLDPDFGRGIRERSGWRTSGCRGLAERLVEKQLHPPPFSVQEVADILFTLTSFHTIESLSNGSRSKSEVCEMVHHLVASALGLNFPAKGTSNPA